MTTTKVDMAMDLLFTHPYSLLSTLNEEEIDELEDRVLVKLGDYRAKARQTERDRMQEMIDDAKDEPSEEEFEELV